MFIIKLFLRIVEPQGAISKEALPGTQMMISTHIETAYNTVIRSIIFRNEFFSFPVNNASINSLADLLLHGETFSRESTVIDWSGKLGYINQLDPNFNKLWPNHMCFPALGATSSSYWLLDTITSALIGCLLPSNYGLRLQIFAHLCYFVQFIAVIV